MRVAFSDRARVAASTQRSIETSTLPGVALAAVILDPSGATAQCTRPTRSRREPSGWVRASFLASALAASLLVPSAAQAGCKDTFKYSFNIGNTPTSTPLQHLVPLGVGSSLNALMSTMNTVNTAFLSPSSSFVSAPGGAAKDQFGGGVWARSVIGEVDTKSTTTATLDGVYAINFGQLTLNGHTTFVKGQHPVGFLNNIFNDDLDALKGTSTCTGSVHEEYYGYQFGYDLAKLNLGGEGANVHFGVTAGYFGSKTKDTTAEFSYVKNQADLPYGLSGTETLLTPEGSLSAKTQVPFIGLYAALTSGNFFADGLVRGDYYLMNLDDPANGLKGESTTATGVSAAANVGYRVKLPGNWFIEPSGGALWSWVRANTITTPGKNLGRLVQEFDTGPNTTWEVSQAITNGGQVTINNIESLLGRATVRIGTTLTIGDVAWQPFATATIFHEFAENVQANSSAQTFVLPNTQQSCSDPCFTALGVGSMNTSTSRIGTFYQYGLGTTIVMGNSGWLGYGRADYRTGDNVEGYSVTGGIRYHW